MSNGDGHGHHVERNGEFCILCDSRPVIKTVGVRPSRLRALAVNKAGHRVIDYLNWV